MIHKAISSGITSFIYSGTHSISRCKTTFGQAEHAISYNFLTVQSFSNCSNSLLFYIHCRQLKCGEDERGHCNLENLAEVGEMSRRKQNSTCCPATVICRTSPAKFSRALKNQIERVLAETELEHYLPPLGTFVHLILGSLRLFRFNGFSTGCFQYRRCSSSHNIVREVSGNQT